MDDIRRGVCPACRHDEIIETKPRGYGAVPLNAQGEVHGWSIKDPLSVSGALVLYVCRACGFSQMYTESPGEIPIGAEHGTRILGADVAGKNVQ